MFVEADDIDSNVSGAEAATEQANRQLAKAATSQKSGTTIVNPPPFHYKKNVYLSYMLSLLTNLNICKMGLI